MRKSIKTVVMPHHLSSYAISTYQSNPVENLLSANLRLDISQSEFQSSE
jgi:hypothetical protein